MKTSFDQNLQTLKAIVNIYDGIQVFEKISLINTLSNQIWKNEEQLNNYHDILLFVASHPENKQIKNLAEKELNRMADFLKTNKKFQLKCVDTSLPFTTMYTPFSHDLLTWMNEYKQCKISLEGFDFAAMDLNKVLKLTLPTLEQDQTTAGMNNGDLLDALKVTTNDQISFLLNEFSKLNSMPLVKDYFWESLQLNLAIKSTDKKFSKAFNKMPIKSVFFQKEMLKKFDSKNLMNTALPPTLAMNEQETNELAAIVKKALVLTRRETDPSTFMDTKTLKYFELERGNSIAIFGMHANRQMPLQSYIGYSAFKNGFPVAYGGAWVFGSTAWFGLNIFDAFRGGESGYIMCQLLRVYKQVFDIDYFEVEPYQYGQGNPDGIKSGAFWFYYRYGFKPVDAALCELAEKESLKIKSKKGYRSSSKTLLQFTHSNIGLTFKETKPTKLFEITTKVREMIAKEFKGNRVEAVDFCINEFIKKTNNSLFIETEKPALIEIALLTQAYQITNKKQIDLLQNMVHSKAANPYEYNRLLTLFTNF